jgi:SNF2 family DNA or RNA helicase
VLRDIVPIEAGRWDLIVLDEGQRIKNWEAKTSQTVKSLRSPFALVLSGTPLENRLDDLFSVVEFIDDRRLGPAFRFLNRHRKDEQGRPKLTVTLPDETALDSLANSLASLLARSNG